MERTGLVCNILTLNNPSTYYLHVAISLSFRLSPTLLNQTSSVGDVTLQQREWTFTSVGTAVVSALLNHFFGLCTVVFIGQLFGNVCLLHVSFRIDNSGILEETLYEASSVFVSIGRIAVAKTLDGFFRCASLRHALCSQLTSSFFLFVSDGLKAVKITINISLMAVSFFILTNHAPGDQGKGYDGNEGSHF